MGNQPTTRRTYTSRTHYTVHCHKHTWINVYDGYSESEYNYYRNSSGNCPKCASERNEIERQRAEERARRAKLEEERRVRMLKERLEREERERQERAARKLEAQREAERKEWQRIRDEVEKERIKIEKSILKESDEKIQEKTAELKSKKTKNPYTAFKQSKTLETVKEIGNKALEFSAAGQVIFERVGEIKQELQKSLKADYKLVKSEVTRYEGYAKEMKSMTTEFIDVFGDIFKTEKGKQEFDKDKFDEDAEQYDDSDNDDDDKKYYQDQMKENIEALSIAINKMRFKLGLMQQHYIKMGEDYEIFVEFIRTQKSQYETMKAGISGHLTAISDHLKTQKERDVFQGQKGDEFKQKLSIEEKYDVINCTVEETQVQIGTEITTGNYAAEGAAIGDISGAIIGGVAGGIAGGFVAGEAGAVIGAVGGARGGAEVGALIGACIGSLITKKTKTPIMKTETKWKSTKIKNGDSVSLDVDQQIYNAEDHAKALSQIRDAMMPTIQGYLEELESKKESAIKKKQEFKKLELNVKEMIDKAKTFKSNIDVLKDLLSSDKGITTSQKQHLDKKWNDTKGKVDEFLKSIEPMKTINTQ